MKNLSWSTSLIILGVSLIAILGFYMRLDTKQDSNVQAMTESIRSAAISNVNGKSRITPGEVYIQEDEFEADFTRLIKEDGASVFSDDVEFEFEYLKEKENVKAIRVIANDNGKKYTATAVVDVSSKNE